MPAKPRDAAAFMVDAENGDRKNGRVSDKLMLALPRELDAEQRAELVRGYAEEVTQGRAPWLAAFHDQGKDVQNPHAHLIIRDRDPATGKRVAGLSEKGSTDRLRGLWEDHANRALGRAGRPERIDRRTLQAQGIERAPTVHEGPKAQQMERRGAQPESRSRRYRNRPGSRLPHRQVDYRGIDGGRSRPAYNRHVKETPADYWQALDADNQARELDQLRALHHRPDSVEVPLVGRGKEPSHRTDIPRFRVGSGTGFNKPEALEPLFKSEARKPVTGSPLQAKDVAAPFETQPPPDRQPLNKHVLIYGCQLGKGNEKMANRDGNDSEEGRRKAHEAKTNGLTRNFDDLVGNAYDDKGKAYQNMRDFGGKHGTEELYHMLRLNPEMFGEMPKDAAKGTEAPRFRRQLAPAFHNLGKAHDEGNRHGAGNQTPSPRGQEPQGLSSLWDRAPSPSPTQSAPALGSPQRPDQSAQPVPQGRGVNPPSGQSPQQAYPLPNPFSNLPQQPPSTPPEAKPKAPTPNPPRGQVPQQPPSFLSKLPNANPSRPVDGKLGEGARTPSKEYPSPPPSFLSKLPNANAARPVDGKQPQGRPPQGRPAPSRKPRGGRGDDD